MTGPLLGMAVVLAWIANYVFMMLAANPSMALHWVFVLVQCWLNVGLFIVAHDCMHGSFAPRRRWLNTVAGRVCLFLYAGFSYDRLRPAHFEHHKAPGSAADPDFDERHPSAFLAWFVRFMFTYFGLKEFAVMFAFVVAQLLAGVPLVKLYIFWALPAIASALQLFYFGTFLPHRHNAEAFVDGHNARTQNFPELVSLVTCFHFGYHHEHHLQPSVPWWQLPCVHRRVAQAGVSP
jgi:beta-carotene/zeaxanthin 4-ketolase